MKTLAELRAATTPTMALSACPICSQIPASCSRFDKGGDIVRDDIPPEADKLVDYLASETRAAPRGSIKRCPSCHRTYWYDSEYEFIYGGSEDSWSYRRLEVDELFRDEWFIYYRLAPQEPEEVAAQPYFRHHALVRMAGTWRALDDTNATPLTIATLDDVTRLATIDPPVGLEEPEAAMRYSRIVDRMTAPYFKSSPFFSTLPWKRQLTDEERRYKADLERASRIQEEYASRRDGYVEVTKWGVSEFRLICRVLSVFPNGEVRREDAVIGEDIPSRH